MSKLVLLETNGDFEELRDLLKSQLSTILITFLVKRNNQEDPSIVVPFRLCKEVFQSESASSARSTSLNSMVDPADVFAKVDDFLLGSQVSTGSAGNFGGGNKESQLVT